MRYFIILLILLVGCATPKLYPKGYMGTATPYRIDYSAEIKCSKCHKKTELFKHTKDMKTIICNACYKKHYE